MIICYTIPEIWQMENFYFSFILGYFLPFYAQNIKIKKMKKYTWKCHNFTNVYQKPMFT